MAESIDYQTTTSPLEYKYYTDFEKWNDTQKISTAIGGAIGAVLGFSLAFNLDTPYAQRELNLQIDKSINDTKAITHIEAAPKPIHITLAEGTEMTIGVGILAGLVTAGVSLWVRRKAYQNKVRKIDEQVELFCQDLKQYLD